MDGREYEECIAALRREADALLRAARAAGVGTAVPSCPGWTIADLLQHQGKIYGWVTNVCELRPAPPQMHWADVTSPDGDALFEWFGEGAFRFGDVLASAQPQDQVWTWADDATMEFWARRQRNETAVHRWDAQSAAGAIEPIERTVAVDAIDEFFSLVPFRRGAAPVVGNGETIHLHCTDGDGEWLLRFDAGGLEVLREHAKGDVAVRAAASDLLLTVQGRIAASTLEVFGDESVLGRLRDLAW